MSLEADVIAAREVDKIASLIAQYRFSYGTEIELQDRISTVLGRFGIEHSREVRLNAKDRPDFMAGDIAIEVKIGGSRADLLRQIDRYARCEGVSGIVVVTTRASHLNLPSMLNGKPLATSNLLWSAF